MPCVRLALVELTFFFVCVHLFQRPHFNVAASSFFLSVFLLYFCYRFRKEKKYFVSVCIFFFYGGHLFHLKLIREKKIRV